jgi:hypothetical protein
VWYQAQQKFEAPRSSGYLEVHVPRSHWIEKILPVWNLARTKIVEIEFPKDTAGESFLLSYARIEEAEKLFANGQYKQVLTSLRLSLEGLSKSLGFERPGKEFFEGFFTTAHVEKKEKARDALAALYRFLHLGPHEHTNALDANGQQDITRHDARFALTMSYAFFEYITPKP